MPNNDRPSILTLLALLVTAGQADSNDSPHEASKNPTDLELYTKGLDLLSLQHQHQFTLQDQHQFTLQDLLLTHRVQGEEQIERFLESRCVRWVKREENIGRIMLR